MSVEVIPDEAVEAAESAVREAMIEHGPDGHTDGCEEITRAALEAAAPYLTTPAPIEPKNFTRMVDEVLEHKGTPRRKLFEYPYRDDDSRDAIKSAETLVRDILHMSNE